MATEANKAIARHYFDEFLNQGERGRRRGSLRPQLPKSLSRQSSWIAEGDRVVSRYTFRGTHQGTWRGIPPTAKQLTFTGNEIHRIADGRIVEQWSEFDSSGMVRQLGGIPAPGQ